MSKVRYKHSCYSYKHLFLPPDGSTIWTSARVFDTCYSVLAKSTMNPDTAELEAYDYGKSAVHYMKQWIGGNPE